MASRLDHLAEYADEHDFSAEMEHGSWETDCDRDPMVSTSLDIPKSLLTWLRSQAAEQRMRPTAYIRQLIEQARERDGE